MDARVKFSGFHVRKQGLPLFLDESRVGYGCCTPAHSCNGDVVQKQAVDFDLGDSTGGESQNQEGSVGGQATE